MYLTTNRGAQHGDVMDAYKKGCRILPTDQQLANVEKIVGETKKLPTAESFIIREDMITALSAESLADQRFDAAIDVEAIRAKVAEFVPDFSGPISACVRSFSVGYANKVCYEMGPNMNTH